MEKTIGKNLNILKNPWLLNSDRRKNDEHLQAVQKEEKVNLSHIEKRDTNTKVESTDEIKHKAHLMRAASVLDIKKNFKFKWHKHTIEEPLKQITQPLTSQQNIVQSMKEK